MRRFVIVSHTVPPAGDWSLDDLAGGAGRVDVLCRNVQAALCWSHDLRADTEVVMVFAADPAMPRAVRIHGGQVRLLNPDERSTAARIRNALQHPCPDPWWEDVEPGIQVAPFTLAEALAELDGEPVVFHKDGNPLQAAAVPEEPVFLMGDHQPLTDEDLAVAPDAARFSFGGRWLHGNHIIAITQWLLDQEAT